MKVLLLAAGRSTRMKPIEDKNFLCFLGKPLILYQLESLGKAGFNDVVLIGGKHNLERFAGVKISGMKIAVVEQEKLNEGMCGAVMAAREIIKKQEILIVSSNDVVEEKALSLLKKEISGCKCEGLMLAKKVDSYFPGGYLKIDKKGFLKGIVEKPAPEKVPSDLVNLVFHYYKNADILVDLLKTARSKKDDLYEVALDKMLKGGAKIKAVEYDGFWQPIKFPWHVQPVFYQIFREFAKKEPKNGRGVASANIAKSAKIAESAKISGEVIIGENVKIFDNAVIKGPVYIGKNSVVANNCLVRESHIGDDCVIGFGSEVARSFLGNKVWTHSNYIGDSVIGNNVSFGAGSVTGNLRLDEKNIGVKIKDQKVDCDQNKLGLITGDNVRFGVNSSTMPGVKVGNNSVIGPGVVLSQDIGDNCFVKAEVTLKITKNKLDISKIKR